MLGDYVYEFGLCIFGGEFLKFRNSIPKNLEIRQSNNAIEILKK